MELYRVFKMIFSFRGIIWLINQPALSYLCFKIHVSQYDDASHCMCFRERANLQLVNRRLERKVKEMMMQVEEEHHSMQDQKDQVYDTHSLSKDLKLNIQYLSFSHTV